MEEHQEQEEDMEEDDSYKLNYILVESNKYHCINNYVKEHTSLWKLMIKLVKFF